MPKGGTLVKADLQQFFRKLRKFLSPNRVRYYACGEYGDRGFRPHYHAIIFNYWPSDAKEVTTPFNSTLKKKYSLYGSEKLEQIWGKGFIMVGQVNFNTAAYTASYVTKKIQGDDTYVKAYYFQRIPEFALMSKKPGIGSAFYEKYTKEIHDTGKIISNRKEISIPLYYKRKIVETAPEVAARIKWENYVKKQSYERLEAVEKYLYAKQEYFKKNI